MLELLISTCSCKQFSIYEVNPVSGIFYTSLFNFSHVTKDGILYFIFHLLPGIKRKIQFYSASIKRLRIPSMHNLTRTDFASEHHSSHVYFIRRSTAIMHIFFYASIFQFGPQCSNHKHWSKILECFANSPRSLRLILMFIKRELLYQNFRRPSPITSWFSRIIKIVYIDVFLMTF